MSLQTLERKPQVQQVQLKNSAQNSFDLSKKESKRQLVCQWFPTGKKYPKMTAVWVEVCQL